MAERKLSKVVESVCWTTVLIFLLCWDAFAAEPLQIRVTNVRGTQFTVSWVSATAEQGTVRYGTSTNDHDSWAIAEDDRGRATIDDIHHVTISGLTPGVLVYYEIISGSTVDDNGGIYYSVNPGPALVVSGSCQPAGRVFKDEAKSVPAYDSIVYVTILGATEQENSATESVLVTAATNGYWFLDLVNFRTMDYSSSYTYVCGESTILVEAEGGGDGSAEMTIKAVDFQTAESPEMILGAANGNGRVVAMPWIPLLLLDD